MQIQVPDPVFIPIHGFKKTISITKAAVERRGYRRKRINQAAVEIDVQTQIGFCSSEGKDLSRFNFSVINRISGHPPYQKRAVRLR